MSGELELVFGPVIHRVRDLRTAVSWYEQKLGLAPFEVEERDPNDTHALFAIGGTVLELWQARPGEELEITGSSRSTHIVLLADDLDAVHDQLTRRGAEPTPIFQYEEFRQFYAFDPDGNRIMIAQATRPLPWEVLTTGP